jgi:hypothetical protein
MAVVATNSAVRLASGMFSRSTSEPPTLSGKFCLPHRFSDESPFAGTEPRANCLQISQQCMMENVYDEVELSEKFVEAFWTAAKEHATDHFVAWRARTLEETLAKHFFNTNANPSYDVTEFEEWLKTVNPIARLALLLQNN